MSRYTLMNRKVSPSKAWAKTQSKTLDHKIAVILYSILCGFTILKPSFAFWGPFIFFIITALTKMGNILSYMIFSVIVTTVASLINPILGFIASLIFFFLKISSLVKNWKAILAGVFIYLLPTLIVEEFSYYLYYLIPTHNILYNFNVSHSIIILIQLFIIGGFAGLILHLTLNWLYRNEYSTKSALSTMGSAPLIILLLIIPFIINAIGDLIDDIVSGGSSMGDDFVSFRDNYDTIDLDGDGINDNIHNVKGHYRSTPSGGLTYVDPHIRTNPNSIISDNISYHK